jgi:hypothetical protein
MLRFFIFMLGMLTTSRAGSPRFTPDRDEDRSGTREMPNPAGPWWPDPDESPSGPPGGGTYAPQRGPVRGFKGSRGFGGSRGRRRWIPLPVKWGAVILLIGLIFRKAVAWAVLMALSSALHLVGVNVHLPHVKLSWPWQSISAGTTSNIDLGPWVLQKIEGISKPALGTANFNFTFTHKVSKNIGIWPCWYSSTFDAAGHASATVNLNPGAGWWAPSAGHYKLQVLSPPATGTPGRVSVVVVLPKPQLPQSVHDVTIDNTLSHPIDTQHSWTYPGFGCGVLVKPQFAQSVLYAQAQTIAFYKATHSSDVTGPLIRTAEAEAAQTIRNNFIQPTVNAFGYVLDGLTIRWAGTG